jgi:hypothetical protein
LADALPPCWLRFASGGYFAVSVTLFGWMLCHLYSVCADALPPWSSAPGCHFGRAFRVDALPPSFGWADTLPPSFFFSSGECFAVGVHDTVTDLFLGSTESLCGLFRFMV